MKLPPSLILGRGTVKGSLKGSLMAPDLKTAWTLPEANATGGLEVSRETTRVTCKAPALDVSAALHVVPSDIEEMKKAITQAQVTALAAPVSPLAMSKDEKWWRRSYNLPVSTPLLSCSPLRLPCAFQPGRSCRLQNSNRIQSLA